MDIALSLFLSLLTIMMSVQAIRDINEENEERNTARSVADMFENIIGTSFRRFCIFTKNIEKLLQDQHSVKFCGKFGFLLLLALMFIMSFAVIVVQVWILVLMDGLFDDPENSFARTHISIFEGPSYIINGGLQRFSLICSSAAVSCLVSAILMAIFLKPDKSR